MSNARGAKRAAYQKEFNARPEEIKKRAERNAARREYEQKHGDLPATVDVDHAKPLRSGGTNAPGNLRAVAQTKNRGWRRGKSGKGSYD